MFYSTAGQSQVREASQGYFSEYEIQSLEYSYQVRLYFAFNLWSK